MRLVSNQWRQHTQGEGTTDTEEGGKIAPVVVKGVQAYLQEGGVSLALQMMKRYSHQIRAKRKQKK